MNVRRASSWRRFRRNEQTMNKRQRNVKRNCYRRSSYWRIVSIRATALHPDTIQRSIIDDFHEVNLGLNKYVNLKYILYYD